MDENDALAALRRQEEAGLNWFIRRYAAYAATVAANVFAAAGAGEQAADIEEAVADAFVVLWQRAGDVQPGKARAFIAGVARNIAKSKLRHSGREIVLEDDLLQAAADQSVGAVNDAELAFSQEEQAQALRRALLRLSEAEREIFLRYYYYYQPLAQVAAEMAINLSTVKTRLRRGRDKLRRALSEEGFDDENQNR